MKLTIQGQVPAQKNRKIISVNRATGQRFLRQDDRTRAWQNYALWQLKNAMLKLDLVVKTYPIALTCIFYMKDNRPRDLDNCLSSVVDILKKAGVIEDDDWRYINPITLDCEGVDRQNPRVEVIFDE